MSAKIEIFHMKGDERPILRITTDNFYHCGFYENIDDLFESIQQPTIKERIKEQLEKEKSEAI